MVSAPPQIIGFRAKSLIVLSMVLGEHLHVFQVLEANSLSRGGAADIKFGNRASKMKAKINQLEIALAGVLWTRNTTSCRSVDPLFG